MKINIRTTKGNIIDVEINKKFKDIVYTDCLKIAIKHLKTSDLTVIGWTRNYKRKTK